MLLLEEDMPKISRLCDRNDRNVITRTLAIFTAEGPAEANDANQSAVLFCCCFFFTVFLCASTHHATLDKKTDSPTYSVANLRQMYRKCHICSYLPRNARSNLLHFCNHGNGGKCRICFKFAPIRKSRDNLIFS